VKGGQESVAAGNQLVVGLNIKVLVYKSISTDKSSRRNFLVCNTVLKLWRKQCVKYVDECIGS
jgi:hypothetical protein